MHLPWEPGALLGNRWADRCTYPEVRPSSGRPLTEPSLLTGVHWRMPVACMWLSRRHT